MGKYLPTMIDAAGSAELRSGLEQHLQETRSHVIRLEQVFSIIGAEADTESNDVFDKMTSAVKDAIDETQTNNLRDAALIMCGNLVEHYEIALYGTLVAFAKQLGFQDAAQLLQQTLNEEKAADAKLTQLGETRINPSAAQERTAA